MSYLLTPLVISHKVLTRCETPYPHAYRSKIMSKRSQQVAEEIQHILSEVIQYELKDPRVGFASIVSVNLSADLQHARVNISVMDESQREGTMQALEHAKGFLRRRVAQELRHLRMVPDLHLQLDTSLDYTMHIEQLLRQVEEERRHNPPNLQQEE